MNLLIFLTLLLSLIYAIKTQDDCQITRSGTNQSTDCNFDDNDNGRKHNIKQARKAHSSAFCIDLQRQTLMAMMGNDYNDGQ